MKRLAVLVLAAACSRAPAETPTPADAGSSALLFYCHSDLDCRPGSLCDLPTGTCEPLSQPVANLVAERHGTSVQLRWTDYPGAVAYEVARGARTGGAPTTIARVTTASFTDGSLPLYEAGEYFVRALMASSRAAWAYAFLPAAPAAPMELRVTSSPHALHLSWAGTAARYVVSRSSSAAGPFTARATVTATSFDDTGLGESETWWYVVASFTGDTGGLTSAPVAGTTAPPPPPAPQHVTATLVDPQTAGASWDPVPGAVRYAVSLNGALQDTVTGTSYVAIWLQLGPDSSVTFSVVAQGDGGDSPPGVSNTVTTAPGPLRGTITATGIVSSIVLTWQDKIRSYPVTYRVLRGAGSAGPFAEVAAVSGLGWTDATTGDWTSWCYEVVVDYGTGQTSPSAVSCAESRGPPDQLNAGVAPLGTLDDVGHRYGQTFVVRQSGQLIGLEYSFSHTYDYGMAANLFAGPHFLGRVGTGGAGSPYNPNPPAPLDPSNNGPRYIDVTPSNVFVVAGEHLRFEAVSSIIGMIPQLGTTPGDAYPAGAMTVDGIEVTDGTDLAFKTVVRPAAGPLTAPTGLSSWPLDNGIEVRWSGEAGATAYHVWRSDDGGVTFADFGIVHDVFYDDTTVGTGFVTYRVAAVSPLGESAPASLVAHRRGPLDAQRTASSYFYGGVTQPITVGATGLLTGVTIQAPRGTATVSVKDAAGVTHGPVSVFIDVTDTGSLDTPFPFYVDLSALGVRVATGDVIALSVNGLWLSAGDDPGGSLTSGSTVVPDRSLWFQTWVQGP